MLATLADQPFSHPDWVFERKLDGVRCLAFRDRGDVRLMSRNRKPLTDTYPEVTAALARQRKSRFVVDGEIVAFRDGVSSFERLQGRLGLTDPARARATSIPVFYYLFDVIWLEGYDVTGLQLRDRKRLLRSTLTFQGAVRYSSHRDRAGEETYREACARGLEGVVAKRAASSYVHRRSTDWLKFKCVAEQELVIGGWTDPEGARTGFGALLVGYYENGALVYAGKVGTGYDQATLRQLGAKLRRLSRARSPFDRGDPPTRGTHWVQPALVAQFGFTEWTRDGRLRHPRYLGLRDDKPAHAVVRERPRVVSGRSRRV
jgi:bifunctional non-homologous end joining protein LigD